MLNFDLNLVIHSIAAKTVLIKTINELKATQGMDAYQWLSISPVCVSDLWTIVAVTHAIYVVSLLIIVQTVAHWVLAGRHDWRWSTRWRWMHGERRCTGGLLCSIHIRLLLCFANIFLVTNALIAEPITDLRNLRQLKQRRKITRLLFISTHNLSAIIKMTSKNTEHIFNQIVEQNFYCFFQLKLLKSYAIRMKF